MLHVRLSSLWKHGSWKTKPWKYYNCVSQAESTKHNQTRKILDTIPKRGPLAFDKFYEAILESANEHIADVLKPELKGLHPYTGGGGERGYAPEQADMDLPESRF